MIADVDKSIPMERLLHIFPGSPSPRHAQSGGGKGIKIFESYFEDNSVPVDSIVLHSKSDWELLKILRKGGIEKYSHALIHYPMFIFSVLYLKVKYPNLIIVVRSHNAEFPHWLQHAYLECKENNIKRSLKCLFVAMRNGLGELVMARCAHFILAITEWETTHYWMKIAPSDRVLYTPYFLPDGLAIQEDLKPVTVKRCVCLMAPSHSSFLYNAAKNFNYLASGYTGCDDWSFCITGDEKNVPRSLASNIQKVGFVDDVEKFLRCSAAIAILTEFGFGFKTKILEAAAAGCWSLVPVKTMRFIPDAVKCFCIPVDIGCKKSFDAALTESLRSPPCFEDVNDQLKNRVKKSLVNSLGREWSSNASKRCEK
jgi:hypothetical protein